MSGNDWRMKKMVMEYFPRLLSKTDSENY